jgi:hypothetical protein
MKKSDLYSLNYKDLLKGLLTAVFTAVLTVIYQAFQTTPFHLDFKEIGMVALGTIIAYLVKNFITNSEDSIMTREIGGTNPPPIKDEK